MKTFARISRPKIRVGDDSFVSIDEKEEDDSFGSEEDAQQETDPFNNKDEREEDLLNRQLKPDIGDICLRYYYKTAESATIVA